MEKLLSGDEFARSYLSPEELCERLPGTTTGYWADHRFHGTGPEFVKLSHKKVVYPSWKLEEWLEARQRTSTRDEAHGGA